MALQDILKKILVDAEETVKGLDVELEEAKKKLIIDSQKIEKSELKSFEDKTQKALDLIETKTRSMARREKSKIILKKKQEIIKDFLNKLQNRLEGLSDDSYEKIIKKLLEKISDTEGTIFVPSSRVKIMKSLIPSGFNIEESDEGLGGFVFKSKAGAEIDNSFQSLIHSEFRSRLEMYFSEQLKFI